MTVSDSIPLRNVLCIRADNMGDVLMSSPALCALKDTFGSKITLLTSQAGSLVAPYLNCVDELIIAELPWVKSIAEDAPDLQVLAADIASRNFDAAIIFTVYSQSSLPAAMLVSIAGVNIRAAYSRENPYDLLTTWLPDTEPYQQILHQVDRDLNLVKALGAKPVDIHIRLKRNVADFKLVHEKLAPFHLRLETPFLLLHPGVSEEKRRFPVDLWIAAGKLLEERFNIPLLISGSASERELAGHIAAGIGINAINVAGMFSLGGFIEVVAHAACVVSVNTSTIHIAAATQTPVVVLYAQTNPQHTPWQSPHEILPFSVPKHLQSRNPIIRDVASWLYQEEIPYPEPADIAAAVSRLIVLRNHGLDPVPNEG
ncbi:glycosyltransferase family 9 protein [Dyadobacter luticola]|nr:glycosyltransferase family 9 protein [Dyadobacter luticola]